MKRLAAEPLVVLTLAMLAGSANQVVGRAAAGEIPPLALAFWRWTVALVVLLPLAAPALWRARREFRRHWKLIVALAATAIAAFNSVLYLGLEHTTAINGSLGLAAIPLVTVVLSWLFLGQRASATVLAGVMVGFLGVIVIVSRGRLETLTGLSFNRGDLLVFVAVLCWALYGVLLARLPRGPDPLALLLATVALGLAMIAPFYAWEVAEGRRMILSPTGVLSILYVGVIASVVGFGLWNRGVALAGASTASQFVYLQPVFGGFWAVVLLGEPVEPHHAGVLLIFLGIFLATRRRPEARST
jgi:drug/metabolite transporter (DMT)-like permease